MPYTTTIITKTMTQHLEKLMHFFIQTVIHYEYTKYTVN